MKILIVGDILRPSSFANVNLHTWYYLNKLHDTWIYPVQTEDDTMDALIQRYACHLSDLSNLLANKIYKENKPQHFDVILYFSVHYLNSKCTINATADKHIFFTVWSHLEYPTMWAKDLNRFDEIWTPSITNRNAVVEAGCSKPVYTIPHGYEPLLFKKQMKIKQSAFRFGMCNSICNFKGADLAINAFLETFDMNDPVELWIMSTAFLREKDNQTDQHGHYEEELKSIIARHGKECRIFYTVKNCNLAEMAEFYHAVDCIVSPHRGDGFGLVGLESLACGTPIIMSKYHGPLDYTRDAYPYWVSGRIEWTDRKSGRHHFPDGGQDDQTYHYFEPNFDDLKSCMKQVYTKWQNNDTIDTYNYLLGNTWKQVAQIIDKRLRGE